MLAKAAVVGPVSFYFPASDQFEANGAQSFEIGNYDGASFNDNNIADKAGGNPVTRI